MAPLRPLDVYKLYVCITLSSAKFDHNTDCCFIKKWYISVSSTDLQIQTIFLNLCWTYLLQLTQGLANRRTGATSANADSSRSHCVFTCVIKSESKVSIKFWLSKTLYLLIMPIPILNLCEHLLIGKNIIVLFSFILPLVSVLDLLIMMLYLFDFLQADCSFEFWSLLYTRFILVLSILTKAQDN